MKEMQQALNEYMRELAEEAQRNPGDQQRKTACRACRCRRPIATDAGRAAAG
jgi:hypothetical protein